MNKWNFADKPTTIALSTRDIFFDNHDVLFVYHDIDDGMWQFHSNKDPKEEEAVVIVLKDIINRDKTICELKDLPLGYYAYRKTKKDKWIKEKNYDQFE